MTKHNIEKEIWKDIKGYEGYYQISNKGRVKSLSRVSAQNHIMPEIILKLDVDKRGYCQVTLYKDAKKSRQKVHRLVAQHFIPNVKGHDQVNHLDENPTNNNVENLEWCTQAYNNLYNNRHKKIGKKLENPVIVEKDGEVMMFESARKASIELNLPESSVSRYVNKPSGRYRGYRFQRI